MSDTSLISLPAERSKRHTQTPSYLYDYHCALLQSSPFLAPHHTTPYPLSSVFSSEKFKFPYCLYLLSYSRETEPINFKQAMTSDKWKEAVDEELQVMELNRTWSITTLPLGKKLVGCKWGFTTKYHSNGSVERYKARLVAKGLTQHEGVDFDENFPPVA